MQGVKQQAFSVLLLQQELLVSRVRPMHDVVEHVQL
jgi:hypothetical protein